MPETGKAKKPKPAGVRVAAGRATAPAWITLRVLGGECRWLVRPLETAIARAADSAASQEIRLARLRREDLAKMGQEPDPAALDLDDPRIAYGAWQAAYLRHVARIAAMDWTGMIDDQTGADLPFSAELVDAVMCDPEIAAAFDAAYLLPNRLRSAEKNGSGPASPGSTAAGLTPAAPAGLPTPSPTRSPSSEAPASSSTATGAAA